MATNEFFYIPYLIFFIILHQKCFVYFIIYVKERKLFIQNFLLDRYGNDGFKVRMLLKSAINGAERRIKHHT